MTRLRPTVAICTCPVGSATNTSTSPSRITSREAAGLALAHQGRAGLIGGDAALGGDRQQRLRGRTARTSDAAPGFRAISSAGTASDPASSASKDGICRAGSVPPGRVPQFPDRTSRPGWAPVSSPLSKSDAARDDAVVHRKFSLCRMGRHGPPGACRLGPLFAAFHRIDTRSRCEGEAVVRRGSGAPAGCIYRREVCDRPACIYRAVPLRATTAAPRQEAGINRAIGLVRARQVAEAHQELADDKPAGKAESFPEQAGPFVERTRMVRGQPVVKRAMRRAQLAGFGGHWR